MKVRIAVAPGSGTFEAASFADLVDTLEREAVDTLWLSDVPLGTGAVPVVGLAFAAGRSSHLKLGANVVPLGRNPMMLARELAQLDQLSGGRLLLSIVAGIGHPKERAALGVGEADRGAYLDEVVPLMREWWSGRPVSHRSESFAFEDVVVLPRPVQDPLELWFGGIGPVALDRAGRLGDGWLGAGLTPAEAGAARATIEAAASAAGRFVDPEHFGMSVPYARTEPVGSLPPLRRGARPPLEPAAILPVGAHRIRSLLEAYTSEGISKFVLRSVLGVSDWRDEISFLGDAALVLQT